MRLCKRGLNFVQIYDDLGSVRICSWTKDGYVGNLLENSLEEIYHGEKANKLRNRLAQGDYSLCNVDDCPWLACGEIDDNLVEIDEVPQYPEELYLAYENICNYNCITCNIHERMLTTDKSELNKRYDMIEESYKEILPHIKHISANGQGELFVSKRIIKVLQNWKPLAPKEECSVSLETNGVLFDEKHWKLIENLGEYNLRVTVSLMSFDEYTYRQLSGTTLPISQIIENLKFIKSLREKGIVNDFRIATVVQERNFREMPYFAKRCLEEFNVDYVRLRSFVPWGKNAIEQEWFMDVINPYHPYHAEYVEIMKDPIFQHPKVHDWSGGIGTTLGEHPYKKRTEIQKQQLKIQQMYILEPSVFKDNIYNTIPIGESIIIYGIGYLGKLLMEVMSGEYDVRFIVDNYYEGNGYKNVSVIKEEELYSCKKAEYIIVTPLGNVESIVEGLQNVGFAEDRIITMERLFNINE